MVGKVTFSGVDFTGTLFVDTNEDEDRDYVGFIFSYQVRYKGIKQYKLVSHHYYFKILNPAFLIVSSTAYFTKTQDNRHFYAVMWKAFDWREGKHYF